MENIYYVYAAFVDKKLKYIGKGKGNRYEHVTSGCSHVYGLNESYFQGKTIEVGIVRDNLTESEALDLEAGLIWGMGGAEDICLYNIANGFHVLITNPNMTEKEFYEECDIKRTVKYEGKPYKLHPAYRDSNRGEVRHW